MSGDRPILIVDDDPDIRETFADALRFEGYTVEAAENGREAVDWLRQHDDARWVVLLDMMMPVMDGATFLTVRQQDPVLSSFPIILLTAGGDCRELAAMHDVRGCVPKTITLPALVAAIEACP